jgi:3-oxoacyl-[acyl-carrier protein] reductase
MSLVDKVVVITGAGRPNGIGAGIARCFANEGAKVVITDLDGSPIDATAASIGPQATGLVADAADQHSMAQAAERVLALHGRIDVLVNNAGIVRDNLLGMLEDADIEAVLDTNIGGTFNVTRAVARHMISKRSGRIINLSSVAATKGGRGQSNYAASKGAIEAFTRAMAVELASRRITVNCVAPGVIETEMSQQVRDLADEQIKARILLRRYGQAEDVANAVWFLASRFADYVTGEVLHVDGGFKMD